MSVKNNYLTNKWKTCVNWKYIYNYEQNLGIVLNGVFGYLLLLKIKNWKHCSKIIFKCVNSAVGPSFEIVFAEESTCRSCEQCVFAEKSTCGFHEQYTGPTGKRGTQLKSAF